MKTANLNAYRSLAKNIDLPDHVKNSVTDKAARLREAERFDGERAYCAQAMPNATRRAPSRKALRPQRLVRGFALGACALALVGGGVLASGIVGTPSGGETLGAQGPTPIAGSPSGNFFALAAYADENPGGDPGQTVTLDGKNFGIIPSSSGDDNGNMDVAYQFNLACTATNVTAVTYTITNSDARFETYDVQEFKKAHGINEDGTSEAASTDETSGSSYQITSDQSLTLDYAQQPIDPTKLSCTLHVVFPLEGEAKELNDQMADGSVDTADTIERFWNLIAVDAAQTLAQARINLTATFEDGSTQTKTYIIAPIEDFAQKQEAYSKARLEAYAQVGQGQTEAVDALEQPELFTITEQA